ncbi:MAG: hypothetical protein KAH93_01465 [Candidatus Aenigmarchaeota archaeon]|nr:hypothetical protein [Candidatus Aenigmarchaeota archaeon]
MSYGKDIGFVCAFLIAVWMVAGNGDYGGYLSSATIKVPVMNGSKGAQVVDASISLVPGTGRVLVDIGDAYVDEYRAQPMIKDAASAGFGIAEACAEEYDVAVSFDCGGAMIEGESMGAAVAVGIAAAAMGREVMPSVAITGAIRQDGRILSAGKILDKARALKKEGVETFLVPEGNAIDTNYVERKVCAEGSECVGVVEKEEIDVGREVGINVIEVANLEDALEYMLK